MDWTSECPSVKSTCLGIIWGMSGHHLGHIWRIIWGMSGVCLGQYVNNGQQSAVPFVKFTIDWWTHIQKFSYWDNYLPLADPPLELWKCQCKCHHCHELPWLLWKTDWADNVSWSTVMEIRDLTEKPLLWEEKSSMDHSHSLLWQWIELCPLTWYCQCKP